MGSLATSARGQPFASLLTPACAPDLSILMLLSTLSEHTRHLMADPRCSILVTGSPEGTNPQTAPRLTVTGVAERADDASLKEGALKARFLAVHPYAALYAEFGDFAIWRVKPRAGLFVGGFAQATRLTEGALMPEAEAVAAMAAAEADIIGHCNQDHADALAAIATAASRPRPGEETPACIWRMVTADVDGCDLACGEKVVRVAWSAPVSQPMEVRRELVRLARHARERIGATTGPDRPAEPA